jgi:predicted MPP superfamily phosphohydrolase
LTTLPPIPVPKRPRSERQKRFTRRQFLGTAGCAVAGLAYYSGEYERHALDVTHKTIQLEGLPETFHGLKIAQISDIHFKEFTEAGFLRDVIDQINKLKPDMVVFTGDFVSNGPFSQAFSLECGHACAKLLGTITCPHKYAVLGNHDVIVGAAAITEALVSNGIPVLANRSLPIERGGERIWLSGLEDAVLQRPDLSAALPPHRDPGREPLVLLVHEPDIASQFIRNGVSLMLSGHTHGGQVRIPFLRPVYLPALGKDFVEGHFRFQDGLQLYVNRGIGTVGVPFRFNCPPELTILTLAPSVDRP